MTPSGEVFEEEAATFAVSEPLLEVHIFDFDENIYGRLLTVRFHHKIREEQMFASIEALKTQIHVDIGIVREWFAHA